METTIIKRGQSGFGHVAALVTVVLLIAIAGTGYYVWHSAKEDISNQTSVNSLADSSNASDDADLTKLPLGDGKVSTTQAKAGYVYSCTNNFRQGGASHSGSWISGNTWNLETKPTVEGDENWPTASISIAKDGNKRVISGNGLPVDTMTGIFPIKPGSVAYQYDRNPNAIQSQSVMAALPANPAMASKPGCVGLGVIGYMTNGVALFNALDDAGLDAAAHEIQDKCDGHPQRRGIYHYHSLSRCLENNESNNQLLGYALDGFGIFGNRDANGNTITNDMLDECHGMTSEIVWDGKRVKMYHYVINHEYPYSLGCFRGTPVRVR